MAQNLPKLPDWEQVSTNVIRILGGNPSKFTLQGTNTYLLGRGPRRLLIDTAQGHKEWISTVRNVLDAQESKSTTISTAILTHWHPDHIGGVKDLEALVPDVKVYKHLPELDPEKTLDPTRVIDIENGQRFKIDGEDGGSGSGLEIEAIHSPGHAKDHMAFIITASPDAREVGAIFTADNVLGHGTAVFENLSEYLDSLSLMKRRVQESRAAYPGHGVVISDAVAKIDEYIAHRRMRELEALNVLKYGTVASGKEWTSLDMVKVIYRHYPENLYQPAEFGLLMVLEKLRSDGKVVKTTEGRWRATEKAIL
ncbi:uncharacterized protein A1O9_10116 [Exophiala aquamarina CBS 119918]|uniref:Metallo-beta-lactamase domain-containing protein n=1 Tax=Exophiala aquamarina CBS 119918 TaxID=1182545 RepID=A0A072PDT2_9EURO|nr:uncharacterized protein A1O9_10116 [Exophiala aquamarina CBS 119918]KEF53715.1 hypothetical protein A1O9_10116 [Exophiala aquamarina CBS 119918]